MPLQCVYTLQWHFLYLSTMEYTNKTTGIKYRVIAVPAGANIYNVDIYHQGTYLPVFSQVIKAASKQDACDKAIAKYAGK